MKACLQRLIPSVKSMCNKVCENNDYDENNADVQIIFFLLGNLGQDVWMFCKTETDCPIFTLEVACRFQRHH